MTMLTKPRTCLMGLLTATALCCWSSSSGAQIADQKDALIVSSFALAGDPVARDVRTNALSVSESLLGLGYNVRRLENPKDADLNAAITARPDVIYYAGTEAVHAMNITAALMPQTAEPVLVFLDVCRAERVLRDDIARAWTLPDTLPDNSFVAASIAPDTPCGTKTAPVTAQFLDALQVPGLSLALAFASDGDAAPVWTRSTLRDPVVLRKPSSDMRLTVDDYALLESLSPQAQAQMIALWTQAGIAVDLDESGVVKPATQVSVRDSIVISAPVKPVRTSVQVISPRATSGSGRLRDGITVIAPSATQSVENRAVPGVGGLPTPSVIVGLIATEAGFGTVTEDTGAVTASEFDYADIDARRDMRADDPALYASLIEAGAFDPPPSELVFALQAELTRMNCYNRGIDGDWGAGSAAGLRRYYEQVDTTPENLDATVASFRQIMIEGDVTCPQIVAQPAARAPRATQTTRQTQRAAPTRSAPRAAAPAAPAAAPTRTMRGNAGVGIGVTR